MIGKLIVVTVFFSLVTIGYTIKELIHIYFNKEDK